jgi:hypothetical protein
LSSELHSSDHALSIQALLEDEIDATTFDGAMAELGANPASMRSLANVQFVNDALQGNPSPDRRYTARIMKFIAKAEAAGVVLDDLDEMGSL